MTMLKEGPNFEDVNRIKRLCLEGKTPAEISQELQIKEPAVLVCIEGLDGVEVNEAPAGETVSDDEKSSTDPLPEGGENTGDPAPAGETGGPSDSFIQS